MLFKAIFKQRCILCSSYQGTDLGICEPCLQDLPWHQANQCLQCALLSDGRTCGNCLAAPPSFDATYAVFTYNFPLDKLLQQYKYRDTLQLSYSFATLLQQKLKLDHRKIDLVIPMPMHNKRLQERGFNQALEIARLLCNASELTLDYIACQRTKLTPPQASLPLKERAKNIRGVFSCQKNLQGLNIALIDDVMTTGASLDELAKTLKQAGAAHVECWVVARTLPN